VSEETVAKKKESRIPAETLELYEKLIATRPEIERKGDVHPYTSVNGHMFTYLDQSGILGIRLAHEEVDPFLKKYNTALFETYGVVKKDWVTVPDSLLRKARELQKYLDRSYEFTKTLKPK
jgi:predicted DNA-binding protein (MmcQ/YjbR family)